MEPIPVIDVRHGLAVAAVRGERAAYRPLQTPLAEGSDPVAVAAGYRRLFPFPRIYLADLDGIEGRGHDAGLLTRLNAALPDVEIWIDDGTRASVAAERIADAPRATLVLGSESLRDMQDIVSLRALPADRYVLSLDFREDGFIGPEQVLLEPEYWPHDVIVMTLARVGAAQGPDLERIAQIAAAAGGRRIFAAGGVRDASDIVALRAAGAHGVLLATALHAEKIKAGDLHQIASL
jgi:phosphoribosylformimino-5-aminoimidazole carboxamide ribotide isomerase